MLPDFQFRETLLVMVWSPVTGKILETSSEENRPQVPLKVNLSHTSGPLPQQEEQGQRQRPRWPGDKAELHSTPVSPGAWLRPASVHNSPSESQVPAEAQVASILHRLREPTLEPDSWAPISAPLAGCETSHRSLNLSGLSFLIHHRGGTYIYIYISITGNKKSFSHESQSP